MARTRKADSPLLSRLLMRLAPRKNGCFEWSGHRTTAGYGALTFGGKKLLVHRAMWEEWKGKIPDGMSVLHRCDNPACANIQHLFLGTPKDNTADCLQKGRATWIGAVTGERHPFTGLRNSDVRAIRRRYLRGESQTSIAQSFNLHQSSVSRIVNHKNWKHIC